MSPHVSHRKRRPRFSLLIGAVAAALALAVATGCGEDGESFAVADQAVAAEHSHTKAAPVIHTEAGHAFQDDMRKLWEDHVTWTRLAIVSFVDDLSDLKPTVARLLQNQTDIGNAIKPYYGDQAGEQLTKLLEGHINGAVELLTAAKAGDQKQVKKETAAWYRNGNQIADFLHEANPRHWARGEMRKMMRDHLDLTLAEAVAHLEQDHRTDIRTYDRIHRQILHMADMLSEGIGDQFPRRFR